MSEEVSYNMELWNNQTLKGRDYNEIYQLITTNLKECEALKATFESTHPSAFALAVEIETTIAEFSKNLQLIKCFTSTAVADDEWKEIQEKIGKIL